MWLFGPNVEKMEQRGDVKGLGKALRHGDPAISTAAAKALNRLGLPDDPKARAWHAVVTRNWDAAVSLGEPSIVPLYTLIGSENDELRESAIRSLIAIGLPPATGMICADDPDPVHLAFKLARSSQSPERDRKLDALSRLFIGCGEPALKRLMGFVGVMALDPCEAEFVSVMLARIGSPQAIQSLCDAMEKCMDLLEADRCMRCAVAYGKGLIAFGPKSVASVGALISKHKGGNAVIVPVSVLAGIGDPSGLSYLVGVMGNCGVAAHQDYPYNARLAATEAMAQIGTDAAIGPLCHALSDYAEEIRLAAVKGLAAIGTPKARQAISRMVDDRNWQVKEAAQNALAKMGK